MAAALSLTPDQQNDCMTQERGFLKRLFQSALEGNTDRIVSIVEEYSRQHLDVSVVDILGQFKDGRKRTLLHFVCQSPLVNGPQLQQLLNWIQQQPPPNDKNNNKDTLLALLKRKDQEGLTPFMLAAQESTNLEYAQERVACLLKLHPPLALARSHSGATALHYAAGAGATATTVRLIRQAAPVALTTNSRKGGTPLHWAAALQGDYTQSTLLALLENNDNDDDQKKKKVLDALNDQQMTPLVLAMAAGNDAHAKFLVGHGASVDTKLPGNVTLLHMAADCNLVGTLHALVQRVSSSSKQEDALVATNDDGDTPLDLAVREQHLGCVMILLGENNEDKAREYMHQAAAAAKPDSSTSRQEQEQQQQEQLEKPKGQQDDHPTEQEAKEIVSRLLSMPEASAANQEKAMAFKKRGNTAYAQKDYQEAVQWYTQALDLDPTEATLYSNRSACHVSLGQTEEALTDAVCCVALKPDWTKAHYRLAVARLGVHRYEDAAVAAWEGLALDNTNDELKSLVQKCVRLGRKHHRQQQQQQQR